MLVAAVRMIIGNAVVLTLAAGWFASLAFRRGSALRIRNALRLRRGDARDFDWTPATVPADFRVERQPPPKEIAEALREIRLPEIESDWERALALVSLLVRHWKNDGPIRSDLVGTFRGITTGAGYCADYVRVFLAGASEVGLFCRQWAFSFDGFGGHGHTFVDVFDRQRGKWAFLDVHTNVYAVRAGSDEPLDALGLRALLLEEPTSIEFRRATEGRVGFEDFDKLLNYYRRGVDEWYLWWGNDVISRNSGGIPRALQPVSGRLAHRLGSALHLPEIVVVCTVKNEKQIARMESLKRRFIGSAVLVASLALLLGVQLVIESSK